MVKYLTIGLQSSKYALFALETSTLTSCCKKYAGCGLMEISVFMRLQLAVDTLRRLILKAWVVSHPEILLVIGFILIALGGWQLFFERPSRMDQKLGDGVLILGGILTLFMGAHFNSWV